MSNTTFSLVKVYEIDGIPTESQGVNLDLASHWNDSGGLKVVLRVGGRSYMVFASDLRAAIAAVTAR